VLFATVRRLHPSALAVLRDPLAFLFLLGSWVAIVAAGLTALWHYELAAGEPGTPPPRWPLASAIAPAPERPTLVMWLHPRCPCSRASLEELDRVMARVGDRVTAHVVFVVPPGDGGAWGGTDLWAHASSIRGVSTVRDEGGVEADRFQAWTSGETVLYGADGRLLFAGGITGSRGHAGDNTGEEALVAGILGHSDSLPNAPVFGCALPLRAQPHGAAEAG
jgi:hypothetical protein